jgi:hypothetical protein
MLNSRELKLLGQIEILEARIEELSIQNQSLRSGFGASKLEIVENPEKAAPANYLRNFIAAATFPLAAGLFRIVYKRIYRLKK